MVEHLSLPARPDQAVQALLDASRDRPVLLFKKSPTCPINNAAEQELRDWLAGPATARPMAVAVVDVIAERALARASPRSWKFNTSPPRRSCSTTARCCGTPATSA